MLLSAVVVQDEIEKRELGAQLCFPKTRPAFSFALLLLDPPIYDDDLFSEE